MNYQLVLNLNSHVIGRSFDDVFEALWQLEWMRSAVFDRQTNPFYAPDVFYPAGWYLASGAQPAWYFLALAPLTALFGPVTTFNIVQLLTLTFAGFGTYLLVNKLTASRPAGIIAGFIYGFAPTITFHMGGHAHFMLAAMWMPYFLLAFYQALTASTTKRWLWAILSGVCCALMILGNWYFLFIGTLPMLGLLFFARPQSSWKDRLLVTAGSGLVCLLLITPAVYLTWQANYQMFGTLAKYSLSDTDFHSLSLDRLFLPNPNHPLWGEAAKAYYGEVSGEQDFVSLGYAAFLLAVIGVAAMPWSQTKPFVAVAALALILAMGTTLHWRGQRVELESPRFILSAYEGLDLDLTNEGVPILLPDALLHKFLPFYSSLRVWSRYDGPFMLAVSILAGFGATYLIRGGRALAFAALGLGLVVLFESLVAPYIYFTAVADNDRQANDWLATLPTGTVLIEYPRPAVNNLAMYSQSLHGQRVVNGYMSHQPKHLAAVNEALGKWPDQDSVPVLREWQVDYIIVSALVDEPNDQQVLADIGSVPDFCHLRSFEDGFMLWNETHVFKVLKPGEACLKAEGAGAG